VPPHWGDFAPAAMKLVGSSAWCLAWVASKSLLPGSWRHLAFFSRTNRGPGIAFIQGQWRAHAILLRGSILWVGSRFCTLAKLRIFADALALVAAEYRGGTFSGGLRRERCVLSAPPPRVSQIFICSQVNCSTLYSPQSSRNRHALGPALPGCDLGLPRRR
jgi:hypothetical protein